MVHLPLSTHLLFLLSMLRWGVSHSQLHIEPDSLTDNVTQVPQARSSEQAHYTERQPSGARGFNSFGQ